MKETGGFLGRSGFACPPLAALATALLICISANATPYEGLKRVDFQGHLAPADVARIAEWAVESGDHRGMPFIVVDKVNATAVAFDRNGRWLESAVILTGMGIGDKFPPGIADMDMYLTTPSQRITPAGRYLAEEGKNTDRETVLWVDYDNGIALHKLSPKRTKQRRQERMASPDPRDNRITYGCINVPPAFYDRVVAKHFRANGGIVYVLPETTSLTAVFKSYDVGEPRLTPVLQAPAGGTPATQRF